MLCDCSSLPRPVLLSARLLWLSSLITPLQPYEPSLLFLEPHQACSCVSTTSLVLPSPWHTVKWLLGSCSPSFRFSSVISVRLSLAKHLKTSNSHQHSPATPSTPFTFPRGAQPNTPNNTYIQWFTLHLRVSSMRGSDFCPFIHCSIPRARLLSGVCYVSVLQAGHSYMPAVKQGGLPACCKVGERVPGGTVERLCSR